MINNIKNTFSNLWNNKITSLLIILGVVIGVTSVIVLISLGQGLKNDVSSLVQDLGSNVMAIVGGKIDTSNIQGNSGSNPTQFLTGDILTENDVKVVKNTDGVESVAPMSLVSTSIKYQDALATPMIIGTTSEFLDTVEIVKLGSGEMITDNSDDKSIVISDGTKELLFGGDGAIDKKVTLGTTEFTVVGVLAKPADSIVGGDFDDINIVSFDSATFLNKDQVKIFRIITKA